MAAKKSHPGNPVNKKRTSPKKILQTKKATPEKKESEKEDSKTTPEKSIQKEIASQNIAEDAQSVGDCICKQKKPNGKFYSFRLIQGRWVQASSVPFPTKEICEEACC